MSSDDAEFRHFVRTSRIIAWKIKKIFITMSKIRIYTEYRMRKLLLYPNQNTFKKK